jgi:hypothetical protein
MKIITFGVTVTVVTSQHAQMFKNLRIFERMGFKMFSEGCHTKHICKFCSSLCDIIVW